MQQRQRNLEIDTGILVTGVGHDTAPHVDPAVGDARRRKVCRNDCRREQFTVADDAVVPHLGLMGIVDARADMALQLRKKVFHFGQGGNSAGKQFADHLAMITPQSGNMLHRRRPVARLQRHEDTFQSIGRLAHRRHDYEQPFLILDDRA